MNLSDLNVEAELIPFFDISLNRHSREALSSLFYTIPKTTGAVLERQQVLTGFTANLNNIKNLQSYKADMEEAYEFCCRLENRLPASINKLRQFRIHLLFSKKETARLLSRSIQLLTLFEKIYQHYFSRVDINRFPEQYRESIRNIVYTVSVFEKDRSVLIEKGNNLSIGDVARFLHKLYAVCKSGQLLKCWSDLFLFEAFLSIFKSQTHPLFRSRRFINGFYNPNIPQALFARHLHRLFL